jgi:uncharacterized protein
MTVIKILLVMLAMLFSSTPAWAEKYKTIEWTDLLPKKDLEALTNGPEIEHNTPEVTAKLNMNNTASKQKGPQSPFDRAMVSTAVKPEFNNQRIRLISYIVPLEFDAEQKTTEFFLVPYYGACIHVPPPPPNQLIHVVYPKGFLQEDLQLPYWVEGTLHTQQITKDTTVAAYTLTINAIKPNE